MSRAVLLFVRTSLVYGKIGGVVAETAVSIRAQNRERITAAILADARRQIAEVGASGLSLRAIARELQMASSALYRYFPSRDALLTTLIIDSYNSLGEAAERASIAASGTSRPDQFRAICNSVRQWALANRHEFFLIYGTPVAGYAAPQDTIEPATRVANLLLALLDQAPATTSLPERLTEAAESPEPQDLGTALAPIRALVPSTVPTQVLAAAVGTFSAMFGAISFELSGQLENVIADTEQHRQVYYNALVDVWLRSLGWE